MNIEDLNQRISNQLLSKSFDNKYVLADQVQFNNYLSGIDEISNQFLLHFVAFFHVASLFSTGVDNKKVGVDNEKALELDNRIFFSYFTLISI